MLCSKVAFVNGVLFTISIGIFLWIVIYNALQVHPPPPGAQHMPHHPAIPGGIPPPPPPSPPPHHGCITVKTGGNRWAHWLPGASQPPVMIYVKKLPSCFASNILRVCAIRDGGVQNRSLLFRKNQAKWPAVTDRHFVT